MTTLPTDPAQREAMAWLHGARFLTTASQLHQLPAPTVPELAFVGRSNAGKSSAINALAQHRRLAFSSRTPGRTQHINLFDLGPRVAPDARLADLPGYGYAAVERGAKLRWQAVMAQYLQERACLAAVVLLVDARLGMTELDQRLLELMRSRVHSAQLGLLVLLTKADKLNRYQAQQALQQVQTELQAWSESASAQADVGVTLFSAASGLGVADVATALHGRRQTQAATLAPAPAVADGST